MDDIIKRLDEQDRKLDAIYASAERTSCGPLDRPGCRTGIRPSDPDNKACFINS